MNLLNKELIVIGVLIAVLFGIQQYLPKKSEAEPTPKKKEGFAGGLVNAMSGDKAPTGKNTGDNTIGLIVGGVFAFLFIAVFIYINYFRRR